MTRLFGGETLTSQPFAPYLLQAFYGHSSQHPCLPMARKLIGTIVLLTVDLMSAQSAGGDQVSLRSEKLHQRVAL